MLVAGESGEQTARAVLERLVEATEARRGFIVVRSGETYEQRFDVRYAPERVPAEELSFSRSFVRYALDSGQILDLADPAEDPRFASLESVALLAPSAVLVVPLRHEGQVWGVLYLQRPGSGPRARFSPEARSIVEEIADLAGLFLRRAFEREALRERNQSLERDLFSKFSFPGIVTQDPGMLRLLRVVAQVADSEAPVLLLGESGTGKELLAQALHLNSSRASKPFVALHCAALPANVLEASCSATRAAPSRGPTASARDASPRPRAAPCSSTRSPRSRTRCRRSSCGSSSSARSSASARTGPRRSTCACWRRRTRTCPRWSLAAERALLGHAWPGNVRELEHVVQRACLLSSGPELDVDLPQAPAPQPSAIPVRFTTLDNEELKAVRAQAIEDIERAFLAALLERHGGSVAAAAREAGMQRTYLQKLLARHRGRR
jgi:transcriptional regulator with GAF, ATPase, and Fis domain